MKRRADGRFQKKIKLPNGKTKTLYSAAKSEREAVKDFNRQMLTLETEQRNSMNFDRVAEAWADERFPTLQNSTILSYKTNKNEAVNYFASMPIAEISVNDIKSYLDMLTRKRYAKKTVKERYAVVKQIFQFAIEREYIEKNPCVLVKLKMPKSAITPKREAATPEEENIIKNLSNDVPFAFFAKFLLFTGCRRGEALALTPKDIDFDAKTVSINKTVEWWGNAPHLKNTPKTEAGTREIPLLEILLDEISKRKHQKYIFENQEHELMRHSQISRRWAALKRQTGINCTPHQLRHSYATMLFDAGIDVKTAQRWLGHTDIKTTLDTYTHLSNARQEQSVNKWGDFVKSLYR